MDLFSDDARRNPFPAYQQLLEHLPVVREPRSGLWMVFEYGGVKRVLSDHEAFSSRHGPDWMNFTDPPRHAKLRALISKAFTPKSITALEGRIRGLSRELLDRTLPSGEMDLIGDYAVPLPTLVIAEMLGIPATDRPRFTRWNDILVRMSYAVVPGASGGEQALNDFVASTAETRAYLAELLSARRAEPRDDLLTRLVHAEVDGEGLADEEILGFFQLLLLAGTETTTNLIGNAILCFVQNPEQLELLRSRSELLPRAGEEVLRHRSPLQWMYRITRRDTEVGGQTIPAGVMVLAMIGAANHDPSVFANPEHFDITRDPNPHIAFGIGSHFCLGAPLARLEGRIALADLLLDRLDRIELAEPGPWEPRRGLHVHGPARLPIRFHATSTR